MLRRNEPKQPDEFIRIGTIGDVSFWTFCPFWDISINKKERKIIMLENTMSIQEIFTVQNIVIYFIVINLFGFFIMWLDKRKAKNVYFSTQDAKSSICYRFSVYYHT